MIHKLSVVISLMLFTNWFVILFIFYLFILHLCQLMQCFMVGKKNLK